GWIAVKVSSSKLMRGWPAPMIRWVTNLLAWLPMWHDAHSLARATGSSVGYSPAAMFSLWLTPEMWVPSQPDAPPWHDSQPTPSETWNWRPRWLAAGLSAWQLRQMSA